MSLKESSRIKISPDVLFREIDGEGVILNPKTGIYFGLDKTGTDIWEWMQKKNAFRSLLSAMTENYDVDAETCRKDLTHFLEALEKNQLISVYEA